MVVRVFNDGSLLLTAESDCERRYLEAVNAACIDGGSLIAKPEDGQPPARLLLSPGERIPARKQSQ